jgi:hypothetical protein
MIYFPTQESSPFLASRLGLKEASLRTSRFRRRGMRKMSVIAWRDVRGRRRPAARGGPTIYGRFPGPTRCSCRVGPAARGGLLPVVRRPAARGGPTIYDMVHAAYGGVVYSRATPCGWPADAGGWTGGWRLDWWMAAGLVDDRWACGRGWLGWGWWLGLGMAVGLLAAELKIRPASESPAR